MYLVFQILLFFTNLAVRCTCIYQFNKDNYKNFLDFGFLFIETRLIIIAIFFQTYKS